MWNINKIAVKHVAGRTMLLWNPVYERKNKAVALGRFIISKTKLRVILKLQVNFRDDLLQECENVSRIYENDKYGNEQVKKRMLCSAIPARSLYY